MAPSWPCTAWIWLAWQFHCLSEFDMYYRPYQHYHSVGHNVSSNWIILSAVIGLSMVSVSAIPNQIGICLMFSPYILGYLSCLWLIIMCFTGPSPVSTLTLADFTTTSLKISWAAVTPSSGYRVTISPDEGIQIQLPSTVEYSRTNLAPGRQYTFTVYTESGEEESLPTSDVFFTSKCFKFYLQLHNSFFFSNGNWGQISELCWVM